KSGRGAQPQQERHGPQIPDPVSDRTPHPMLPMNNMDRLIVITGASGAGKTTAAKILEPRLTDFAFFYFDAIVVPSAEEMIKQYGSGEEWQRHKTMEWVRRLTAECLDRSRAVLD